MRWFIQILKNYITSDTKSELTSKNQKNPGQNNTNKYYKAHMEVVWTLAITEAHLGD